MKKLVLLSLTLLAAVFALSNITKAADAIVNLEITGTPGRCVWGQNTDLWDKPYQTYSYSFTWDFLTQSGNNNWICADTEWAAAWQLTVVSTALTDANSNTIPAANVYMNATGGVAVSNDSQTFTYDDWDMNITEVSIGTTKHVFDKTSGVSTIGTLTASDVKLRVYIDSGQNIGIYTGTITIAVPADLI